MRKNLLFSALLVSSFSFSLNTFSQNDRFAFAITDLQSTGSGWNALRKLDLKSGEFTTVLLNGSDASMPAYDMSTRKAWKAMPGAQFGDIMQIPFSTGVAAMAYDKKNNRL